MRMILNNRSSQSPEHPLEAAPAAKRGRVARWVARFGVAGFLFFLIKGLAWLIVPAALAAYATRS